MGDAPLSPDLQGMRVMIAAGGTGGHLYPGIAMAQAIKDLIPNGQLFFVGTERGLEKRVIPQAGYELHMIKIHGFVGLGILKRLWAILELPYSLFQSYHLLRKIRPDLVIGIGGYASGPVVLMSWLCRIPRVLIEPNAYAGFTNRILAPLAQRIFLAFEEARNQLLTKMKIRVYGNPVRAEVRECSAGRKKNSSFRTILVMGGSQGASSINRAMVEALTPLKSMRDRLRIIHQTGEKDYEWVRQAHEELGYTSSVTPYLPNVAEAYAASELVISRAGATTVAELTACGLPAILIPYPHAANHHQDLNAAVLERKGAVYIIKDKDLTGPVLGSKIHSILRDPMELHEMGMKSHALGRPQAAQKIAEDCLEIIQSRAN